MSERPILFSAQMVRAILDGRKTQTRRAIKQLRCLDPENDLQQAIGACPYGKPGDQLWVRETWADTNGESGPMISYRAGGDRFLVEESYPVDYSKYPNCQFTMWCGDLRRGEEGHKWRPSIHMPRWASRITLEITGVRVERLQEISEEDAMAEGIDYFYAGLFRDYLQPGDVGIGSAVGSFESLWESINGPGSWEANPWVWVVEFQRMEPPK